MEVGGGGGGGEADCLVVGVEADCLVVGGGGGAADCLVGWGLRQIAWCPPGLLVYADLEFI